MNQSLTPQRSAFNFQIVVVVVLIIVYSIRGVLFATYNIENKMLNTFNSSLWYFTSILSFIILGFQILLFKPIPVIKNLFVAITLIFTAGILIDFIQRFAPLNSILENILNILKEVIGIISFLVKTVLFILMLLTRKFKSHPTVKSLHLYALVSIICLLVGLFAPGLVFFLDPSPAILYLQWGSNYFLLGLPLIFLIMGYNKLKRSPQLSV